MNSLHQRPPYTNNAADIITAGADGVSFISVIVGSPNLETAARELRRIIDRARQANKA